MGCLFFNFLGLGKLKRFSFLKKIGGEHLNVQSRVASHQGSISHYTIEVKLYKGIDSILTSLVVLLMIHY